MVKKNEKEIHFPLEDQQRNSEIHHLCRPSSQSSILNSGAQESLSDLTSYSPTQGQIPHSDTYIPALLKNHAMCIHACTCAFTCID